MSDTADDGVPSSYEEVHQALFDRAPATKSQVSAPSTAKSPSQRLPIGDLEDDELTDRWEWFLKACYVQASQRILVPTDINEIFFECRDEINRRNLVERVNLPIILFPDDALPVMHRKTLVRYLRQPHLANFLSGIISFATPHTSPQ